MDLGMPEETHDIEQDDLEELPAGVTACATAMQDSAWNDTESFSSGPRLNGTGDEHDATCIPGVHVASTVHDLTLKMKKQLCLLFFRVAVLHKLRHSTTESIFNDFKVTFLDMIRAFAAQIQQNITLESAGNELRVLLACDFLDEIFQAAGSKYQRDQFAKQHLPYVKPEEHVLDVRDTFHLALFSMNLTCKSEIRLHRSHVESAKVNQPLSTALYGVKVERAWKIARALSGAKVPRHPIAGLAIKSGMSMTKVAELLADEFSRSSIPPHQYQERLTNPPQSQVSQPEDKETSLAACSDFTLKELTQALHHCRKKSAPGPDGITAQSLRNVVLYTTQAYLKSSTPYRGQEHFRMLGKNR
ncbi:hypothetical protein ISCGN_026522 [Ixodes scapularis]